MSAFKESRVIEINPKIKINQGGDLNLHVNMVTGEGEVLIDQPANSLVANFARILYAWANGKTFSDGTFYNSSDSEAFPNVMRDYTETAETVLSVTPGNPTRVQFFGNMNTFDNSGTHGIQLAGVGGITPDINGFWHPDDLTYIADNIVDLDIDTTGSPAFVNESSLVRLWQNFPDNDPRRPSASTLGDFVIMVGRGNVANVADQQCLENEWRASDIVEANTITYTEPTVAVPGFNVSAGTGEMFFSANITNNSGADLAINELGLYARVVDISNDNRYVLIARDLVSTTLTDGSSATVSYKMQTTFSAPGGLLQAFLLQLYRQFAPSAGNTDITDIYGVTHSRGEDDTQFFVAAPSGDTQGMNEFIAGDTSDKLGPQVGTGTTAVAIDDNALETRIAHGESAGTLIHYGAYVTNFQVVGSVASFDIVKLFENQSGGNITVTEIGLYESSDTFEGQIYGVLCMYREVLASSVTVNDGEILKVTMTVELTVA